MPSSIARWGVVVCLVLAGAACGDDGISPLDDGGGAADSGAGAGADGASRPDGAGSTDAGADDGATTTDGGATTTDGGATTTDTGAAPPADGGADLDAGSADAAAPDATPADAGMRVDAGTAQCPAGIDPSFAIDTSGVISQPTHSAVVPVIAARDDGVLVAWHEFAGTSTSAVHYVVIRGGCPGPERAAPERAPTVQRPSVAVTPGGFVLAYHVTTSSGSAVRALWLDPTGAVTAGPETISTAPGGVYAHVATNGRNTAFAWIGTGAHWYALRGDETVTATTTGIPIQSTVVLNSPRPALDSRGTLHLAYRDGGAGSEDWDPLLITRPRGGAFARPINLARSPGYLSDDLAVAIEPDDRLDVLWVQQDAADVNSFEVEYVIVDPLGPTPARRFATQHQWSWMPAVAPGLRAVWRTGTGGSGPLHFSEGPRAPVMILPGVVSDGASIAVAPNGSLHLAVSEHTQPRRVRYAWRP